MPCPSRSGNVAIPALALALAFGLSGCGGGETVGEAMGYEQTGPDEMNVIKRPPLTVPPDFNLRPPRPDEPSSDADDASKAARETLIGPSSGLAPDLPGATDIAPANGTSPSDEPSAANRAQATLTGQKVAANQDQDWQQYHKSPPLAPKEENVAEAAVEATPSAGQTALLSRTNRVERDLDALNETRSENRVDGALLRRLIAWKPEATDADADKSDGKKPETIVQIVRREQTPVSSGTSPE